jgi:hypothetical protein
MFLLKEIFILFPKNIVVKMPWKTILRQVVKKSEMKGVN